MDDIFTDGTFMAFAAAGALTAFAAGIVGNFTALAFGAVTFGAVIFAIFVVAILYFFATLKLFSPPFPADSGSDAPVIFPAVSPWNFFAIFLYADFAILIIAPDSCPAHYF